VSLIVGRSRIGLDHIEISSNNKGIIDMTPINRREYYKYLRSPEWKERRKYMLACAENKCQRCGATNVPLDVHHKTYERFKHEWNEDLVVVCEPCHKILDKVRVNETNQRVEDNRLDGWATKVFGADWEESVDREVANEQFEDWLDQKGEWDAM
jgi:hypothetical protein